MTDAPDLSIDWRAEEKRIRAEQKKLREEWRRKRLILWTECEYGSEQYTAAEMRRAVWMQCEADPLFFFDYFAYTIDPRAEPTEQVMEFIMYEYQRDFVRWFVAEVDKVVGSIDRVNGLVEKSRDMGMSWVLVWLTIWYFLFRHASILWGSRKEEECDKKGDLDTSLERCRFGLNRLPLWLLPQTFDPRKHLGYLLLRNPDGGQIVGESSNPNFGRGGRYLFIIYDELQSWENAEAAWRAGAQSSNARFGVGTPNGPFGLFAELANPDPHHGGTQEVITKRRIHWKDHPIKGAGLRRDHTGQLTSPWYEEQKRTLKPDELAAEVDISYARSVRGLVFPDYTEEHATANLTPADKMPIIRVWDPGLTFFVLWMQVDHYKRVLCLRELCLENARINDVADEVQRISQEYYSGFDFHDCGDPAGARRVSASQVDPEYVVLAENYAIDVDYNFMEQMPTQLRVKNRITAIHNKLREYVYQTRSPGLLVDVPNCKILDKALKENYMYKVGKFSRQLTEQIDERHPYEDAVDCLGYGVLYKLGLATANTRKNIYKVEKGTLTWDAGVRRESKVRYI